MRCFFCLEEREPTEEHVFPEAIGGTLTIDRVCKDCNDFLGAKVDVLLTDHPGILIWHSHKARRIWTVPAGTDVAHKPFPADFDPELLKLSPFNTVLDIQSNDKRIALDSADVIRRIEERGYATHTATVTITISTSPPLPQK